MSGIHTEAVLNKLTKPELVQLLLKTEAALGSQITDLSKEIKDNLTHLKKLEADITVVMTANDRLFKKPVKTERQRWQCNYVDNTVLEETMRGVFKKVDVEIDERDVQACHCLKEKERNIAEFVNRKGCLKVLRVKKELKSFDPTELDSRENTKIFVNERLCPYYRGIWNKCKKLRAVQKIHQFYTISGLIRVKLEETDPYKVITRIVDLKELFPDTDIENL